MFAAIDNWLFLLLIAIAALFRLLAKAAGSKPDSGTEDESTVQQPEPPQEQPRRKPLSDEEQIRKFLEALGQPRTADVPPPVAPRIDIPPRPVAPVQPPRTFIPVPKTPTPQPTKARRVAPAQPKPPPLLPVAKPVKQPVRAEMPTFDVYETSSSAFPETERTEPVSREKKTSDTVDLGRLLRTQRGLRQAIILREVFGTPRSLQPIQNLPGTA